MTCFLCAIGFIVACWVVAILVGVWLDWRDQDPVFGTKTDDTIEP